MIQLTEQQRHELADDPGVPKRFFDPITDQEFVFVRGEWFDSLCQHESLPGLSEEIQAWHYGVHATLLRSMKAYWRELPVHLKGWWKRGKWVAYWGDVRIGIARNQLKLFEKCRRENFPFEQVYFGLIRPRRSPPWEPESFDGTLIEFDDDEPQEAPLTSGES